MGDTLTAIIRTFQFEEVDRPAIGFSDPTLIMLDSAAALAGAVRLRAGADGSFPTASGIYVTSSVANPGAARQLLGFHATIDHVKVDGAQVTTEGFRLFDGTAHYFWNGSAWGAVSPTSSSWNTEAELAAHASAFVLVPARLFGVAVRLGTTDKRYTPVLQRLKVAYQARIFSSLEDMVYRSFARDLKAKLLPLADLAIQLPATGTIVDVGQLDADSGIPFNLAGVEAIFNRDADPELLQDLLQSYDSDAKVATLNSPVPAGATLQVVVRHQPAVVVELTHPDYREVSKAPAYVVDQLQEVRSALTSQDDSVVNKATGAAVVVRAPYQGTLQFRLTANAPTPLDVKRMLEAAKSYFVQHPLLRSTALDEDFRLLLRDEYQGSATPVASGVASASLTGEIQGVVFFSRPSTAGSAVQRLNAGLSEG